MPLNLRHRSFVKELDFTPDELRYLIRLAAGDARRALNAVEAAAGTVLSEGRTAIDLPALEQAVDTAAEPPLGPTFVDYPLDVVFSEADAEIPDPPAVPERMPDGVEEAAGLLAEAGEQDAAAAALAGYALRVAG